MNTRHYYQYEIGEIDYPLYELGERSCDNEFIDSYEFLHDANKALQNETEKCNTCGDGKRCTTMRFYLRENLNHSEAIHAKIDAQCRDIIRTVSINAMCWLGIRFKPIEPKFRLYYNGKVLSLRSDAHSEIRARIFITTYEQETENLSRPIPLSEKDVQDLYRIVQVQDPIIKFFLLYEWMLGSCKGQSQANLEEWIKQSYTFGLHNGREELPERDRQDKKSGKCIKVEETIYTHLRNRLGHAGLEIIDTGEERIKRLINDTLPSLIKLAMEKFQLTEDIEPQ